LLLLWDLRRRQDLQASRGRRPAAATVLAVVLRGHSGPQSATGTSYHEIVRRVLTAVHGGDRSVSAATDAAREIAGALLRSCRWQLLPGMVSAREVSTAACLTLRTRRRLLHVHVPLLLHARGSLVLVSRLVVRCPAELRLLLLWAAMHARNDAGRGTVRRVQHALLLLLHVRWLPATHGAVALRDLLALPRIFFT